MATATKEKRPARTRDGDNAPAGAVAGHVNKGQRKAIDDMIDKRGRRLSEVIRLAVVRLIQDDRAGKIDWTKSVDAGCR